MIAANGKVRRISGNLSGGFTLIELLVVVAIIALLISILLPSLSQARQVARMVKCQALLKQFGTANHMYANESEDWFVPHKLQNSSLPWYRNTKWRAMLGIPPVPPSAGWPAELYCPNTPPDRVHPTLNYGYNGTTDNPNGIVAPKNNEPGLAWNAGDYSSTATGTGVGPGLRIFRAKVRNPSGKVQHIGASDWNTHKNGANYLTRWDIAPDYQPGTGALGHPAAMSASVSYRHNEGANPLMFDGHVEHRHKTEIYYLNAAGAADNAKINNLWDQYR